MPTFEQVIARLVGRREFWPRALIGSLLMFIPLVNLLSLGYLMRMGRETLARGDAVMPAWDRWDRLLFDGLRCFLVILLFAKLPSWLLWGVAAAVYCLLEALHFGIFACVVFILPLALMPVATALALSALHRVISTGQLESLLAVDQVWRNVVAAAPRLAIPILAVFGVCLLGLPLYGFAVFLGMAALIPYAMVTFARAGEG